METLDKELDFGRPPVDEVVLSVLFKSLDGFLAPHLGEIWQELKKEGFLEIAEQPPVMPTVENFPNPNQETKLHFGNVPNLARIWFIHRDGNQIIQVQRDRFMFNWRKTEPNQIYPGFPAIFEKFKEFYNRFGEIIKNLEIGEVSPLQYELTYIDQLMHGDGWDTLDDIGKIYNLFINSQSSNLFWSGAESLILQTSFPIQDLNGRLHLAISHRVRVSDQKQTLQTDFTMRGFPQNADYDAMIRWFKSARGKMREKFLNMFTEDVQTQIWERK